MFGFELIIIIAMIAMNSIFAGYEIALASVSLARLRVLDHENRKGAKAALFMKENIEASLTIIQLGITLVGAIAAATGGAEAGKKLSPLLTHWLSISEGSAKIMAIAAVVIPLTVATIMFGELVPKVFALRNKEWLCLKLSPVMRWFALVVRPIVSLFEGAVRAIIHWSERRWRFSPDGDLPPGTATLNELRAVASLARALRLIGFREEGIILGATALSKRPVREIMLPAEYISTLDVNDSLAEGLIKAHLDMHTRFPVTEYPGNPQSVIGYVNFKDIIAQMRLTPQQTSMGAILRPIPNLADTMPIANCLEIFMREHTHIALVRESSGRIIGMISLEDILEEMVGDIQDEYDRLPSHAVPSGGGWIVGGGLSLTHLRELTGIDLMAVSPQIEAPRLADWVMSYLGRPVQGGDIIEQGNIRLVVRKVRRQKLQEAQLTLAGDNRPEESS